MIRCTLFNWAVYSASRGIDNGTNMWQSVFWYTHYIQAKEWRVRNLFFLFIFFFYKSWMRQSTTVTYEPKRMTQKSKWVLFNTLTRLPLFTPSFLPKTETGYLNVVDPQREKMKEGQFRLLKCTQSFSIYIYIFFFFMQAHDKHLPLLKVSVMHQLKTAQRWFKGQTTEENKDSQVWGGGKNLDSRPNIS